MDNQEEGSRTALVDEAEDINSQTPLHNKYSFWFHRRGHQANKNASYEESIIKLGTFHTVEHFWRIYDHIIHPNEIKSSTDYHLFKEGVKPTWEDPVNRHGGKWMVRVKKGLTSTYWEDLVLAIIGEQFDVGHEICGAVVSVRNENDIISLWNKNADNTEATDKIRDQLRRILKLPVTVAVEYKKHEESLTDNSSYRNPNVIWRAPDHDKVNSSSNNNNHYNRNANQSEHRQNSNAHNTRLSAPPGVPARDNQQGKYYNYNSTVMNSTPANNSNYASNTNATVPKVSSRWDALAPAKAEPSGQSHFGHGSVSKPWRAYSGNQSHPPGWSRGAASANSDVKGASNVTSSTTAAPAVEPKFEREISNESMSSYVTALDEEENLPIERAKESDGIVKGKNIGGWVKAQLQRHSSESAAADADQASIPELTKSKSAPSSEIASVAGSALASTTQVPTSKPSAWRTQAGQPSSAQTIANTQPFTQKSKPADASTESKWGRATK